MCAICGRISREYERGDTGSTKRTESVFLVPFVFFLCLLCSVPDSVRSGGQMHEVLSPGAANEERDRDAKLKLYSRRGVNEYGIIDSQQRRIEVFPPRKCSICADRNVWRNPTRSRRPCFRISPAVSQICSPAFSTKLRLLVRQLSVSPLNQTMPCAIGVILSVE